MQADKAGIVSLKKFLVFTAIYLLTIAVNYFTPMTVRQVYFLVLLAVIWQSKDHPFWLAFVWCLFYAPGYLFLESDPEFSLPFVELPGLGRDIEFKEVVVALLFFKARPFRELVKIEKIFWLPLVFALLMFALSFVWGISAMKIFRSIRFLVPFSLLWSMPRLLPDRKRMEELFFYFLYFTFLIVASQAYVVVSGQHLMVTLGGSFGIGNEDKNDMTFDSLSDLIRPLYSTHLILLNVFFCIYIMLGPKESKQQKMIPLLLLLNLLSFLITGTRGYVVASLFMLLLFAFANLRQLINYVQYMVFAIGVSLLILLSPGVGAQFRLSFERILTVQSVLEGDRTAKGTLMRLTERQPRVLEKANESPLLGFGFSDEFYLYKDGHVANATMYLNGGYVGLLVFAFFISYLIVKAISIYRRNGKKEYLAIVIGIIGFMTVHSTSYMVFSYLLGSANYLAFILLLSFADVLFNESKMSQASQTVSTTSQVPIE
jgi:hypothetical protein